MKRITKSTTILGKRTQSDQTPTLEDNDNDQAPHNCPGIYTIRNPLESIFTSSDTEQHGVPIVPLRRRNRRIIDEGLHGNTSHPNPQPDRPEIYTKRNHVESIFTSSDTQHHAVPIVPLRRGNRRIIDEGLDGNTSYPNPHPNRPGTYAHGIPVESIFTSSDTQHHAVPIGPLRRGNRRMIDEGLYGNTSHPNSQLDRPGIYTNRNPVGSIPKSSDTQHHDVPIVPLRRGNRRIIDEGLDGNKVDPNPQPDCDLPQCEDEFHNFDEMPFVDEHADNATSSNEGYTDLGDAIYECEYCGAFFWHEERVKRVSAKERPKFTLCCNQGNVVLPKMQQPPKLLEDLIFGKDKRGKHFLENIRSYNSMFSFTSMGGKVDHEINQGKNPPIFRLNGQNYHRIGSLLPNDGKRPKFLQMYLSDPSEEISQRISAVRKESGKTLDDTLVRDLKDMLDTHNVHAKSFRMARDRFNESNSTTLKMRLIGKRKSEGRTYNTPTVSEVAALIEGDFHVNKAERDVVVQTKGGAFQFMTELNPSFLGLQYPLLFPYGQDGFREDVRLTRVNDETEQGRNHVTQKEFFSYRVQDRKNESSYILRAKRLFQQFLVDGYTMIESSRLRYIRQHQKELRSDLYSGLADAVGRGETNASRVGQLIVLPNSFTGSARYMMQNYQDAMAICRWAGYPQLFITFTCNPKWPEIVRFVSDRGLNPEDRPDILCRIFKMKLDLLIKDLKHNKIFGDVKAVIYTIEFQKRGLPHAHIVLWVTQKGKRISPSEIDKIISAEIPDERSDPEYYNAVKELMMHGPCGPANKSAPCMDKNVCTKHFPKRFVEQTTIDGDGYPVYRRRNDGRRVTKGDVDLDNRHVVAHNRTLLLKYGAHINVEWCNQTRSVKYLFKYINKGDDRITVEFSEAVDNSKQQQVDEIKMYYDCRYISACEAAWRIFGYPIHYRDVPVERLNFHLPDEQPVYYHPDEPMESVVGKGTVQDTKFLAWMKANEKYPEARELTYVEFPTKFTWKQKTKEWVPRKRGFSIGRVYFVRPGAGEKFYLRTLLNVVKGATSFEELRTYNGTLFPSFRDACYARGLLKDDKEYIDGITEASHWASAYALRNLFVTLLLSDVLSKPQLVWEKCSQYFSEDILYNIRRNLNDPEYQLSTDEVKKYCLIEIEKLLRKRCRSLRDFVGMPMPPESDIPSIEDTIIHEELKYDKSVMAETHAKLLKNMNEEQRSVYDKIMESVDKTNGGVFFLYGHGGTGKTYVWKTLSAAIRSRGQIVLNVASSGIASLLLPGGRTAHSRFAIPINVTEDSTCNIKRGSPLAKLIQMAKLIIWDEAPMIHRHCFEALDRSMRDILSCSHDGNPKLPFGGKTIVFGGDFRQVLPVIPKGTRQDIVLASLNASHLWQYCTVLKLTKNMRLKNFTNETANPSILKLFADWILQIGDGVLGGSVDGEAEIDIPENFHVPVMSDPIESIVNATYPDFLKNMNNISYLEGRAILAPTIDEVDKVNDFMLLQNSSEEKTYFSSDSACSSTSDNELLQEIHSPEFLNGIKCSGVPSHELKLKVGVPVMLMRNIDHSAGLCNGTRLLVTKLGEHIIEAQMMSGTNAGEKFLIPRISLTPTDVRLPFTFMRRQFPLMVSYAMTMNKSQGQSLENVGVFLRRPVFTHGQLYVAVSRVTSPSGLKFVICDDEGNRKKTAKNVVYKEVFNNL